MSGQTKRNVVGSVLASALLCSCATERSARLAPELPAKVSMNKDAGRWRMCMLLLVDVRLESGQALPFIVDTGSPYTVFDKSLEPELGKRLSTRSLMNWGTKYNAGVYATPRLYLGTTPLPTGNRCYTLDVARFSPEGRRAVGVLGMDCLHHYCVQLDFGAGEVRFPERGALNRSELGKAFPLTFSREGCPHLPKGSLVGQEAALIDTGATWDASLGSKLFRRALREQSARAAGEHFEHFPKCVWGGNSYTDLSVADGGNALGLGFLARHLVTFDFPQRTMYLKRISSGPLYDTGTQTLLSQLEQGQLPGLSKGDHGNLELQVAPRSLALDVRRAGDSCLYHYKFTRASVDDLWTLRNAWRTDQNGRITEEYRIP